MHQHILPLQLFHQGVVKKYRGHNIGLTLKYLMLEKLLKDPQVKYWITENAGSNDHMIRINHKLGYKEWLTAYMYETKLDELKLISN